MIDHHQQQEVELTSRSRARVFMAAADMVVQVT
jgi:hypothetical protein